MISNSNPIDTDIAFYIELLKKTTFLLNNNNITPEYRVEYNEIKQYINDRMTMLVDDAFLKLNERFTRMRNIDYWKTFIERDPITRGGASDSPSIETTVYSHYAVYLLNKAANEPTKANVNLLLSTIDKYTSKTLLKMQTPSVSQLRRLNYAEYIKIDPRMKDPLYSTIFSMYTDPKMNDFDDGPIKRSRTQKTKSLSKTVSPKVQSAPAILQQPRQIVSVSATKSTLAVKEASLKKQSSKTLTPKVQSAPAVLQEQSMRTSTKKSPKAQSAPAALVLQQPQPSRRESANVSVSVRSSSKKSTSPVKESNIGSNASVDSLFGPGSESPTGPLDTKHTRNSKKK